MNYGKNTSNGFAEQCAAMDERTLRDRIKRLEERACGDGSAAAAAERLTVAYRELHSRFRPDPKVELPSHFQPDPPVEQLAVLDMPATQQASEEAERYRHVDTHVQPAGRKWEFDTEVTQNFPAMLDQSIPGLQDMRRYTEEIARRVLAGREDPYVIDIGASRGDAVARVMEQGLAARYTLYEVSPPMLEVLEQRFGDHAGVEIVGVDLSERPDVLARRARPDLALSVLTLMFIPPENRQAVVQAVHDAMEPGAAFVVVEKTLGNDARTQQLLVDAYHDFKRGNGYTDQQVERKRMSLKGALIPFTTRATEDLLYSAGFVSVQQYWRCLQFVGWVAFKREV